MKEEKIKKGKFGRKKLEEHKVLSERVYVRFSKIDYNIIKHKASSTGKNISLFVRELALMKISDIKIESKTDAINTNQLKKVGVNLNQISKNLNTYKYDSVPDFLIKDIENSLLELKGVLKAIK
jgi:hypothetical protein